jgi:hypothetical protein
LWYNDGVTTDNWLAIGAGATFLLALAAFWAIWQNYSLHKKERKEHLLNEVIDWAEDIRKSSSESIDPSKIVLDDPTMQIASQHDFLRLRRKYQELNKKSAYMKTTIAKVFGGNLLSAVKKIIYKLDETVEILSKCLTSKVSKDNSEKVEEYKKSLDSCTEDLIVEATKIKTRDIS